MLKRDRGRPSWLGSSQARAFTATTTAGGKDTRPALAWEFLQASNALLEEPLTPLAHDLARCIEPTCDLIVGQSLGGIEHDLGADHVPIW
jgi:hypothetical protein